MQILYEIFHGLKFTNSVMMQKLDVLSHKIQVVRIFICSHT
jgi:hypothetical protein